MNLRLSTQGLCEWPTPDPIPITFYFFPRLVGKLPRFHTLAPTDISHKGSSPLGEMQYLLVFRFHAGLGSLLRFTPAGRVESLPATDSPHHQTYEYTQPKTCTATRVHTETQENPR